MRIISQDGCYDAPYEKAMIQRYKNNIYLLSKDLCGVEKMISDPVIAEYSTEEKAIKAMEMCRETYLARETWCDSNGWTYSLKTGTDFPKAFQFPKDEELN